MKIDNIKNIILDSKESKKLDEYTIEAGTSSETLIERAAYAMSECIEESFKRRNRILCFAGPGNNGTDALVLGRILKGKGSKVRICKVTKTGLEYSGDEEVNFKNAEITVDGIFGTGLNREPEGCFKKAIELVNESYAYGSKVISVDVPSGVNSSNGKVYENAVKADMTVTFGFMKYAHVLYPGKEYCGKVKVKDIGFDLGFFEDKASNEGNYRFAEICDINTAVRRLPERFETSNKGSYCNALLICGCEKIPGAAVLSSNAAYRLGAGYVTLCSDKSVRKIAVGAVPELLICEKEEIISRLNNNRYDTVLFGPGAGKGEDCRKILEYLISRKNEEKQKADERVLILDADAINLLAEKLDEITEKESFAEDREKIIKRLSLLEKMFPASTVFTPHRKELSRLLSISMERLSAGSKWVADIICEASEQIFVLKDASSMVCTKHRLFINTCGNNGMSKAGCGDVLAGMLSAICGRCKDRNVLFERVCSAVYLHSAAADRLKEKYSEYGVIPSEIAKTAAELIAETNLENSRKLASRRQ